MQPYIFPYIGYFQLLHAVDKFIVYDDVTFIKQGWINRNNILLNGRPHMFTVPLVNASSNTRICDTQVSGKVNWDTKFLKTLEQAYKKAPYYKEVIPIIADVVSGDRESGIAGLAVKSIQATANYLGISTDIQPTSTGYANNHLAAQSRVLDICRQEHASHFINPIGGTELYSKEDFRTAGLKLSFIKTHTVTYPQYKNEFVPWLSIIDILMFNSPEAVMELMNKYELV